MKFGSFVLVIFSLPLTVLADTLVINTPASAVECQPVAISYSGGTAPYYITVIPGGEPSASPLVQFPEQTEAGSLTWTVNIASGTAISLAIRDGTGDVNYSEQVTIQTGTSTDCVGQSAAVSSAGGSTVAGSTGVSTSAASGSASGSASASASGSSATVVTSSTKTGSTSSKATTSTSASGSTSASASQSSSTTTTSSTSGAEKVVGSLVVGLLAMTASLWV